MALDNAYCRRAVTVSQEACRVWKHRRYRHMNLEQATSTWNRKQTQEAKCLTFILGHTVSLDVVGINFLKLPFDLVGLL